MNLHFLWITDKKKKRSDLPKVYAEELKAVKSRLRKEKKIEVKVEKELEKAKTQVRFLEDRIFSLTTLIERDKNPIENNFPIKKEAT